MCNLLARCLRDERGTEVVEYSLMLGLLVLAAITIIGSLGLKVVERWREVYDIL